MKVTKLSIKNIGIIADTVITLDKPLILFYGEIKQGKSTILKAVRWLCGGEFPQDIIRHGADEASAELEFEGGLIGRSWYRAKDGSTKARPVVFVRGGKPVASPVSEIKRFLNPFLLDQDFLRNKNELERRRYFTELFAVDTTALDSELFDKEREARDLRVEIKSYGEIDLTPVEPVDIAAAQSKLEEIRRQHNEALTKFDAANTSVVEFNGKVSRAIETRGDIASALADHEKKVAELKARLESADKWIAENPMKPEAVRPTAPDTSAIEKIIQEGGATNVRAEQFKANRVRANEKATKEKNLLTLERRAREIREEKTAKLKGVSDSCGIKGLTFDDQGNFIYEGTAAGMISDSQIMKLSSDLSALYPEGFGLDLIDRAESLGKSIFEFVDRAKAEKKTILATIVGERPAKVDPEIGVFVVEKGVVTP